MCSQHYYSTVSNSQLTVESYNRRDQWCLPIPDLSFLVNMKVHQVYHRQVDFSWESPWSVAA